VAAASVVLSIAMLLLAAIPVAALWRSRTEQLIAWGVAVFGGLVIACQALGCIAVATGARAVSAPNLAIASLALCAAAWAVRWRAGRSAPDSPPRVGATVGASRADAATVLVVAGASAVFLTVAIVSALSAPPRGWDVLTYHLPRAVSWLLHGDLGPYGSTGAFYPGNAEFPILTLLFTGSDRLVPLIQIPFALLGAAALFGIARRLGAGLVAAAISAFVFLAAPIVFFQETVAKDDLIVSGLVVAGAFFLIRSLGGRSLAERVRAMAAAGFAMGLALGTKYSILPFAVACVPLAFFFHALSSPRTRGSAGGAAGLVGVFAAAMALPSAFWFVRNALITGNPIEPLSPNIGYWIATPGLDQQFGFVSNATQWWLFPWMDRHLKSTYSGSAGFGAAFAVFFLPALLVSVAAGLRRGARPEARGTLLAVPAMVTLGVVAWWTGKNHLPRFLLPVAALACAPIGLLWDAMAGKVRVALSVILIVAIAFSGAETLRIVFRADDITWSNGHGIARDEFYRVPGLVYRLPVGTKILLLKPTDHDYYQTYRYPLAGRLPGNEVVMEDDYGVTFDLKRDGAFAAHGALVAYGIDYIFMRFFGGRPHTTWFDNYPWLYEKVVDTTEKSYSWYRTSLAVTPEGDLLGAGHVATKMYRVLH
jgi:hypothetical protein